MYPGQIGKVGLNPTPMQSDTWAN